VKSLASDEALIYEEDLPDAFDGADASNDSDFTSELARTRSRGKARLNLGKTHHRATDSWFLSCRCHGLL
jgi:hypothetical protein